LLPEPEMEAVGVPPATFSNANFAEAVEVPPSNRSSVMLSGDRVPSASCQYWVRVVPLLTMVPLQLRLPVALKTVQPVDPKPPAMLTSPVETPAILTAPEVPASRAKFEVPPAATDPPAANVSAVAEVLIVSSDETLESAPLLMLMPLIVFAVAAVMLPELLTVNLVIPDALAVSRSPLFV